MCELLNKQNKIYPVNYDVINYKIEEIVNSDNAILGYEVLIDSSDFSNEFRDIVFNQDLAFSRSSKALVKRLEYNMDKIGSTLNNKYLFINLERSHLCDLSLLKDIEKLHHGLKKYNSKLVVEITERDRCGQCKKVHEGLTILKNYGITLALDDFDANDDFRTPEIYLGFYDFIKIELSNLHENSKKFETLIESIKSKSKIIVEHIETQHSKDKISALNVKYWGLQGYLYNTLSIEI